MIDVEGSPGNVSERLDRERRPWCLLAGEGCLVEGVVSQSRGKVLTFLRFLFSRDEASRPFTDYPTALNSILQPSIRAAGIPHNLAPPPTACPAL